MCLLIQKLFSIQIYYRDNLSVIWVCYVFIPNIEDVNTAWLPRVFPAKTRYTGFTV